MQLLVDLLNKCKRFEIETMTIEVKKTRNVMHLTLFYWARGKQYVS